jgi:rhomboid protease GluP
MTDVDAPALPPGPPPLALAVGLDLVTRYRLRLTDARDGRLGLLGGDQYLLGAAMWTGRRAAFVGFYAAPADSATATADLERRLRDAEAWGNERLGAQGAERCDVLLVALGSSPGRPAVVGSGLGGVSVGAMAVDASTGEVSVLTPPPRGLPSAGEVRAHAKAVLAGRPVPTLAAVDLAERQTVAGGYAQPARRALTQQTVVTYGLIALFVVIWILQRTVKVPFRTPFPEIYFGALVNSGPNSHDWWRYVSSGFLHDPTSPLHILFNGFAMYYIGRLVEQLYGRLVLLGVFLVCVVAGNLLWVGAATVGVTSPSLAPTLGASGGIMGLVGLLLVLGRVQGRDVPVGVVASLRQYAISVVVLTLVIGFLVSTVNNLAHIGGFLAGALLGLWLPPRRSVGGRELRRWEEIFLGAVILVGAIALAVAVQHAYSVLTGTSVPSGVQQLPPI